MPRVAPNVGYVDNTGRLRCSDCADEDHRQFPVAGDTHKSEDDLCCNCGLQLEHIRTSDYVQVAYHSHAPDIVRQTKAKAA